MKGVAQTSNTFPINGKKNSRRNDKLAPKAKFKTGICTADKNQEKQNVRLIRQHKYLYYEFIFSRNTSFSRAFWRLYSITDFSPGNI